MKNILTQIFVSLGVIFLILIMAGVYFFITDPLNLKPLFFGNGTEKTQVKNASATETKNTIPVGAKTTTTGGFVLSDTQKQALINLGIDPASVPTTISATQESCFVSVLGEARVAEIKTGAVPNAIEFFKAKSCI
ncbi:MAG: hypothetical protein WAW13_02130 [Minisyncoccia bacterium]